MPPPGEHAVHSTLDLRRPRLFDLCRGRTLVIVLALVFKASVERGHDERAVFRRKLECFLEDPLRSCVHPFTLLPTAGSDHPRLVIHPPLPRQLRRLRRK